MEAGLARAAVVLQGIQVPPHSFVVLVMVEVLAVGRQCIWNVLGNGRVMAPKFFT